MKQVRGVILDVNDTVLQSSGPMVEQDIFVGRKHFGVHLTREQILANYWGLPADQIYNAMFQTDTPWTDILPTFAQYNDQFPRQPMPDLAETYRAYRDSGLAVAMVSGGSLAITGAGLQRTGFPTVELAHLQFNDDAGGIPYGDPRYLDPALAAFDTLGVDPAEIVVIGDEMANYAAAEGAGLRFVGVGTGQLSVEEFAARGVAEAVASLRETVPLFHL
jgi:beta-phosphoglucomutase-like phosphatase (HAD superfamily)